MWTCVPPFQSFESKRQMKHIDVASSHTLSLRPIVGPLPSSAQRSESWRKQLGHCALDDGRARGADEGGAASYPLLFLLWSPGIGSKNSIHFEEASWGWNRNEFPILIIVIHVTSLGAILFIAREMMKQKQIDRTPSYSFQRLPDPGMDITVIKPDSFFVTCLRTVSLI